MIWSSSVDQVWVTSLWLQGPGDPGATTVVTTTIESLSLTETLEMDMTLVITLPDIVG